MQMVKERTVWESGAEKSYLLPEATFAARNLSLFIWILGTNNRKMLKEKTTPCSVEN